MTLFTRRPKEGRIKGNPLSPLLAEILMDNFEKIINNQGFKDKMRLCP